MFFCFLQPLQRIENEVELLSEHLPVGGFTYPPPAHAPTLQASAPLQFITHDPLHQEVSFGVVSTIFNKLSILACARNIFVLPQLEVYL